MRYSISPQMSRDAFAAADLCDAASPSFRRRARSACFTVSAIACNFHGASLTSTGAFLNAARQFSSSGTSSHAGSGAPPRRANCAVAAAKLRQRYREEIARHVGEHADEHVASLGTPGSVATTLVEELVSQHNRAATGSLIAALDHGHASHRESATGAFPPTPFLPATG